MGQELSPDGREVWDWADRLSKRVSCADEIRTLSKQIFNMENQCGSCEKWMTRRCPAERHDNIRGRSVGPSSVKMKCGQFSASAAHAREIAAAKAKLAQMVAQAQGSASKEPTND